MKTIIRTLTALTLTAALLLPLGACVNPSATSSAVMAASLVSPQAGQFGAFFRVGQMIAARTGANAPQ